MKQIHDALLMSFGLSAKRYGLNQLRYDLRKLRAHALLQRDATHYAYPICAAWHVLLAASAPKADPEMRHLKWRISLLFGAIAVKT